MLKNKIFCFDENNPVFVEKIGSQLKFCAYVIYEWYLKEVGGGGPNLGLVVAEVTGGAGGMLNKGVDPNLFFCFCSIKSPLKSSYSLSQSRPQLLFRWVPPLRRNNKLC